MNKQEMLIRCLEELNGEPEDDHIAAEDLLLEFIEKEVSVEIAEAYRSSRDRVGFFYV